MAGEDSIDILIAEDSRIQAKMLQRYLTKAGFGVRHGENGKIALDMIREQRPTLIISDIEMPEMNGYELCKIVKSDADLKTIPLILLSTLSEAQDIIQGLHVGADNYVTKPYESEYLISRIRSLLDTPIVVEDEEEATVLEVNLAGERYEIKSSKQQVLNLLISTFENAVEKNNELIRVNEELTHAKEQVEKWNAELEVVNGKLEAANNRMSYDLAAAAKVQQSLLPSGLPETPTATYSWHYTPCDELAGDFLNVLQLDEKHVALFVVDVSGHGVASSLLSVTIGRVMTAQTSSTSILVQEGDDGSVTIVPPAKVAEELNNRFQMEDQGELYFTMVYGVLNLETQEFKYVMAGHPAIARVSSEGKSEFLPGEGFPVGMVEGVDYDEHTIQLQKGDRLYLYSDGIPEAMADDETFYGDDRLIEFVSKSRQQPLEETVTSLSQSVRSWYGTASPNDDVSILAIETH